MNGLLEPHQVTLILAFVLALIEVLTGAFFFLGMAMGALLVAALQWVTGEWVLNRDLLLFAVSSVAAFAAFRKLFKKPADQTSEISDVNRY
jgi:membrane protein implicated in regulation of membrane protease activity